MKYKVDAEVRCPFYKGEVKQKIICEGVQRGTAIHMTFDTDPNQNEYKRRFCRTCYNKCLVAQMQNRKWGYDG